MRDRLRHRPRAERSERLGTGQAMGNATLLAASRGYGGQEEGGYQ
jgi:hypothetical protein